MAGIRPPAQAVERTFQITEQIGELYERNPTWARHEREVYGSLLIETPVV